MKPIGGFFETEAALDGAGEYHRDGLRLCSARSAFRVALEELRPSRVRLPFYSCASLLEPVALLGIPHDYYDLDEQLAPPEFRDLGADECVVVINYFGLQTDRLAPLAQRLGRRLVFDNTQAFFDHGIPGCFSFNSTRKFFGVPDGGYLLGALQRQPELQRSPFASIEHMELRAQGRQDEAYGAFRRHEDSFTPCLGRMSDYTAGILARLDYDGIRQRRIGNFRLYQEALGNLNRFAADLRGDSVPFCYPFLTGRGIDRPACHRQGVFFPLLWPEVASARTGEFAFERGFAQRLAPLPVDHRYTAADIERVIEVVRHQVL